MIRGGFFNLFAKMARNLPFLPLIGGGTTKFQPVYVGDVADAVMAAIKLPNVGKDSPIGNIYELGGPEILEFRDIYNRLFFYTRRSRMMINLSFRMAKLQASLLSLMPKPLLTPDQVESLKTDSLVGKNAKGLAELGVEPTGMGMILPEYLETYCPGGHYSNKKRA